MSTPLLEVHGLEVWFGQGTDEIRALQGVSLSIARGEIVGLVGESGSGKTITSLALMGLLDPAGSRVRGAAMLDGKPLWDSAGQHARRRDIPMAMVFQEPMTALDPVFTVGSQLVETLRYRRQATRKQAHTEAVDLLDQVGIPDPAARMRAYPHELSGGMRQRVMIAIALACDPMLLIADEPTTAVDATIQAQLLELISSLASKRRMSVLLVTHDMGVVAETCSRMITMYAGQIVESGPVREVLTAPAHPYTAALLAALPTPRTRGQRLATIPGRVAAAGSGSGGCVFADRCRHVSPECGIAPNLTQHAEHREVRCARADSLHLAGARW